MLFFILSKHILSLVCKAFIVRIERVREQSWGSKYKTGYLSLVYIVNIYSSGVRLKILS
jgi:hypothetical protein